MFGTVSLITVVAHRMAAALVSCGVQSSTARISQSPFVLSSENVPLFRFHLRCWGALLAASTANDGPFAESCAWT